MCSAQEGGGFVGAQKSQDGGLVSDLIGCVSIVLYHGIIFCRGTCCNVLSCVVLFLLFLMLSLSCKRWNRTTLTCNLY